MKRKITAILMATSILAANNAVLAQENGIFSKNTELLQAFDIIKTSEDLQEDAYVTRGEFAQYLAGAMRISSGRAVGFTDVSEEYIDAVSALEKYNIVYGNGAEFRPDDIITTCDAAVMVMRALGYEKIAQLQGGYPNGYLSMAGDEGVLDGIENQAGDYATLDTVMKMLCNMLETEMYVVKLSGADVNYEQGKTFMEQYYNAYKATGILQGNYEVNINGVAPNGNKNSVTFDYNEYNTDLDLSDYLGYNLKIYYTSQDGENTIIYAEEAKQNNVYVISGYDITDFDSDNYELEYENENKTKKLRFYNGTEFILNGEYVNNTTQTDMLPKDGVLKAVDNNSDGKIDVFFITKYDYAIAQNISLNGEFITDKITNKKLTIDNEVKIIKEDENISLGDVAEDSLLELMYNSEGVLKQMRVYDKNEGICNGADPENYLIDGEKTELSEFYGKSKNAGKTETPVLGNLVTYWKNGDGRIVWLTCDTSEKFLYAYLIKAYKDDEIERGVFKVLSQDGSFERVTMTENVKFNETKAKGTELVENEEFADGFGNTKRQLIMYSKNAKGEMNKLFTARDTLQDAVAGGVDKDFAQNYGDVETILKNGDKFSLDFYTQTSIRHVKGQFYSTYGITEQTAIFNVPEPSDTDVEDDDFCIGTTSQFEGDKLYGNLYFYDFDENLNAACLVHYGSKTETFSGGGVIVVDSVTQEVNAENEIKPKVTGYRNGKAVEYTGEDSEYISKESAWGTLMGENYADIGWNDLKKGDIMFISLNKDNEINAYRLIAHNVKSLKADYMLGGYSSTEVINGRDSYGASQFLTGVVYKKESGYFFVKTKTTAGIEVIRRLKATGGIYNLQKNKLNIASFNDISVGDRVAVKCSYDVPAETVIIEG